MDCIRDCVRRVGKFTKLYHYMLVLDERPLRRAPHGIKTDAENASSKGSTGIGVIIPKVA